MLAVRFAAPHVKGVSLCMKVPVCVACLSYLTKTAVQKLLMVTGEQETRAWTIKDGFTAPQAAGVIHTDFERGFIRAETVSYNQYTSTGGFGAAREKGVLRLEGKEYIVQEGDVMLFRFNV